jgi:hypothetical protein
MPRASAIVVVSCLLSCLLWAAPLSAQEPASSEEPLARVAGPTSGAASLLSGRTLGSGETMIAAAAGWPGVWGEIAFAPASELNVHVRGTFLYGAPFLGLVEGIGGELAVPVRVHVLGDGQIDLAIRMTPRVAVGEGRLFGEREGLGGAFAGGLVVDVHGVLGFALDPNVTLIAGLGGGAGGSIVDRSSLGVAWVARVSGELGLEALVSRDFMLFAHVEGGYGFAPDRAGLPFYPAREVLGVSLGAGYVL